MTRSKRGLTKPIQRLNLHISTTPHSYLQAFKDPNWSKALKEEYDALIKNGIWDLVPRPTCVNIV